MPVKLNSAGGGSVTIDTPSTASNFTLTVPAATGTAMVSGGMPAFSAYQSAAAQTYNSATATKITFDVEEFDTNNNFASSRFTPTVAGYYQINAAVSVNSVSGNCYIQIYKNGSEFKRGMQQNQAVSFTASGLVYCNGTTDYIEIYFTNGVVGSNFTSNNSSILTWVTGSMVRAA